MRSHIIAEPCVRTWCRTYTMGMLVLMLCFLNAGLTHAQTAATPVRDPLQDQIDQSNAHITQLKKEIKELQVQLNSTGKQKQTLQNAIQSLSLNIKKLEKSILLTNAQIKQRDSQIFVLSGNISTTTNEIVLVQREVGGTLEQLSRQDFEPSAFLLLGGGSLSSLFDEAASLATIRSGLQNKAQELSRLKTNLITSKSAAEQKRMELRLLQQNLAQQKQSLGIARKEQTQLLQETNNKESNYQRLIAQKNAQERKFEQELSAYEAQLNLKVNKGALPSAGSTPLEWPVDSPMITQYFGNTPFSTANPQVYNGKGHNAIDFRASPGSPIKAARAGVILGTGNTDLTCPGASYGKWIFIKHDDGISTIYAHLSVISVTEGQNVGTGEVIGYAGTTGYATGPHLHFGVYASSGSVIASFPSKSCSGRMYTMPLADISAYLNPLSYLPAIAQ